MKRTLLSLTIALGLSTSQVTGIEAQPDIDFPVPENQHRFVSIGSQDDSVERLMILDEENWGHGTRYFRVLQVFAEGSYTLARTSILSAEHYGTSPLCSLIKNLSGFLPDNTEVMVKELEPIFHAQILTPEGTLRALYCGVNEADPKLQQICLESSSYACF